jgi:ornithine--oxo-acid transaminase
MVEPIQGEMGVIIPPTGYLKKVHELLKKYNALLITDEIQTGLGRTGNMLCADHDTVRADIVLLGKALSGGFTPVSAMLCDSEIMDLVNPGEHGSTYGGSSLASAVTITALEVIINEKMCQNSARQGERLLKAFKGIFTNNRVKEIRGRGLFIGIEFSAKKKDALDFALRLLENGLIAKPTHDNIIRFAPPLIIKDD